MATILVVEPCAELARLIADLCEDGGCTARVTASFEEALLVALGERLHGAIVSVEYARGEEHQLLVEALAALHPPPVVVLLSEDNRPRDLLPTVIHLRKPGGFGALRDTLFGARVVAIT